MPEPDMEKMATLPDWMRDNPVPEDLRYKTVAREQLLFFRDYITFLFLPQKLKDSSRFNDRIAFCKVAGAHTSKSIHLPVYFLETPNITVIARNNFHNWNVTVIGKQDIDLPDYFDIDHGKGYLFMEGMSHWQRGLYAENRREFSFCVWDDYLFFAVMMCVGSQAYPRPDFPVAARHGPG